MPRKVNRQEWVDCPRCGARAYEHCRNYRGQKKPPCKVTPPPGNNQAAPAAPVQRGLFDSLNPKE